MRKKVTDLTVVSTFNYEAVKCDRIGERIYYFKFFFNMLTRHEVRILIQFTEKNNKTRSYLVGIYFRFVFPATSWNSWTRKIPFCFPFCAINSAKIRI